ncbi:hypothetical protein GCM10023149_22280 [Mucilaginibacter gynuensis]|uniref:Uncharacterized protein n=1 Tax=Mucilaginibacter gynuensis TaxID=1302236 RepID=A0ABP8GD54_9SPHI
MKRFHENQTVIYTSPEGQMIDTFVVFDTDLATGLTHINHFNLKVPSDSLELHAKTVGRYHLPMADAFSFEIFRKMKEKYGYTGTPAVERELKPEENEQSKLRFIAKAS